MCVMHQPGMVRDSSHVASHHGTWAASIWRGGTGVVDLAFTGQGPLVDAVAARPKGVPREGTTVRRQ